MTREEASIHLVLSNFEDLDDAIESSLFATKQELIQKADNILLFSAKEKKCKTLQEASEKLGFIFPSEEQIQVHELPKDGMEAVFHSFHQQRAHILRQLNQVKSFDGIIRVQHALLDNYRNWLNYWMASPLDLALEDIKLSSVIDSMRFLQWILRIKEQGIYQVHQLNETTIPNDIQHEICRLRKLHERLN